MGITEHQSRQVRAGRERSRLGGELGVTVVEMLMATMILGVGVLGVSSLFVTSSRAGSTAEARTTAAEFVTAELERIRSWPFETVGVSPSAPGFVAAVDGRPTVVEEAENRIVPEEVVERNGFDFEVERAVTWASLPGQPEAYKVVTVSVTWTAGGLAQSVTMQTGLYRGGGGA